MTESKIFKLTQHIFFSLSIRSEYKVLEALINSKIYIDLISVHVCPFVDDLGQVTWKASIWAEGKPKGRSLPSSPAERSQIANVPRRVCTEGRAWRCCAPPLAWCRCAMADTAGETSSRAAATASRALDSRLVRRSFTFVPRIRTAMMEYWDGIRIIIDSLAVQLQTNSTGLDLMHVVLPSHASHRMGPNRAVSRYSSCS